MSESTTPDKKTAQGSVAEGKALEAQAPISASAPEVDALEPVVEPVAEKAEPVAEDAKQDAEKAEPVAEKAEPVAEEAEPVAEKAEPVAEKAEPVAEKAEPVAEKAEPVADAAPTPPAAKEVTPKVAGEAKKAQRVPALDEAAVAEAAKWGRFDSEGNVWLREESGERLVGQYKVDGSQSDALNLYIRRYLDLENQVSLAESRVMHISPEEAATSLKSLNEQLVEPAVVGDVDSLRKRVAALGEVAAKRREDVRKEREAAKAAALEERTAIVVAAEAIAAQNPQSTHWKNSRAELSTLLDQWKYAQRNSARIDRGSEDELWRRFSTARTTFDRHRRQFFSNKDAERKEVVARKESLIARAEELADSTDWGATSALFRDLMAEWKRAGRTNKRVDDGLWERFSAAQNRFYDARNAHNAEIDREFAANRDLKLELLAEAEKLLPVTDVEYAKTQIRSIGERWDAIGRVPRADMQRTEGRLRDIETEIRNAETEQWNKSDPLKTERTSGMAAQLQHIIDELEEQIAEAKAAGDKKKLKEYEESLAARKAWLAAIQD